MDNVCKSISAAAQGKAKGALSKTTVSGRDLLQLAEELTRAVHSSSNEELRSVTRCKQFGNAGHVLLHKADSLKSSSSSVDYAACLTAAVLCLSNTSAVASAIQEAADSSSSSHSGSSLGAAPSFSHNDVKECASLCARLASDCMSAVGKAACSGGGGAIAFFSAPVLGMLGALEQGFTQLGPAFRRIGVDAVNFSVIMGTALPSARNSASRVVAAAIGCLGRVRRTGPADASSSGSAGAAAARGATSGSWAYEPAPYVRAALGAIEQHLLVARQAAAHAPCRLTSAQEVTTLFRSAGDLAGHQLSQLTPSGVPAGIAAVDDGSSGLGDKDMAPTVAARLQLLVGAVQHIVAPSHAFRVAVQPDTVSLPIPAVLQLTSVLCDVQGMQQLLGSSTNLVVEGQGSTVVPAAEALASAGLQLLSALVTQLGARLRRFRTHVLRVLAGVMQQGNSSGTLLRLSLAAVGALTAYARQVGLGSGNAAAGGADVTGTVMRACAVCLHTLHSYSNNSNSSGTVLTVDSVVLSLSVLHELVACHWHGLPDGLRLVIERCGIALASGLPLQQASSSTGPQLSLTMTGASSSNAGASTGTGADGSDVMMLGDGLEEEYGGGDGPASKRQRTAGAISSSAGASVVSTSSPPLMGGEALLQLRVSAGARAVVQHSQAVTQALLGLLTQCIASPWQGGALSPLSHQLRSSAAALGCHAHYATAPLGLAGLVARALTQAELGAVKQPAGLPSFNGSLGGAVAASEASLSSGSAAAPPSFAALSAQAGPSFGAGAMSQAAPSSASFAAAVPSAAAAAAAPASFSFPNSSSFVAPQSQASAPAPSSSSSAAAAGVGAGAGDDGDDDFPDIVDEEPDKY